jgi:hypothetical protein
MNVEVKRLRAWLAWKVFLPFVFIALMWPVYLCFHRSDAFERAFAHGEFLIYGAIVLLEVALELKYVRDRTGDADLYSEVARIGAVVIIFIFGFTHTAVLRAEEIVVFRTDLVYYSCFGCTVATAAVSVGFYTYWKRRAALMAGKLKTVANPG